VKQSLKILSIVTALGLLVAMLGIGTVLAKQGNTSGLGQLDSSFAPQALVAPAAKDVEWADTSGNDITHIVASTTGVFFINDATLATTKTATTSFTGLSSDTYFDIAQGRAGTTASNATSTGVTFAITSPTDYSQGSPTTTPIKSITVVVGSITQGGVGLDGPNGVFTLVTGTSATTTTTFVYDLVDSYAGSSTTLRRAKVTSTSDPQGEYVTISEVVSVSSSSASPTSGVFRGEVVLSSSAAAQGTNNDGVWLQDGDTLTVSYLKSDGTSEDSDSITVDDVKPTISAIAPADGTITNIVNPSVSFEVTDSGSGMSTTDPGTAVRIRISPVSGAHTTSTVATTGPAFQAIADGFRVIYAISTSWLTTHSATGIADGVAFTWEIEATDKAGNVKILDGASLDLTIDVTKPTVASASTGTGWNTDTAVETTNSNTSVKVIFSEDLDASTVDAADFTVGGETPTAAVVGTTTGLKDTVYLTVAEQASDAKPIVVVTGEIKDKATNILDTALATDTATATDVVKPTITVAVDTTLGVLAGVIKTTVTTDEKLAVGGLIMTVDGPGDSTAVTPTSPSPLIREGSFTIAAGTGTGNYGISVQAQDLGGNLQNNLTKVTTETVAASKISADGLTITLANGPIADFNFDGVVDGDDISAITLDGTATTTTAATATVNASARTITLPGSVTGDVVKVTYHYTTDTFQVDQSAPAVTFDPATGTTKEDQSPFIRLTFDEDEYPGDTFKTITLTKAELTRPGATTAEDILANFGSGDDIEFIWSASDLELGAYTLKVSATDTAGNKLTDSSSTFTIAERALISVALRPGWNLVSFPGVPIDTAIGSVITVADVDTVIAYDPTAAGAWLTAVRDSDGNFAGTLSTIDAASGYWVHTTSFTPIKVDIPGITAGATALPPSWPLVAGWNLVPVTSLDRAATAFDADSYFTGLDWSRAYEYNNTTNSFTSILPAVATTGQTNITVGKGYWLFLNKAGTLVP